MATCNCGSVGRGKTFEFFIGKEALNVAVHLNEQPNLNSDTLIQKSYKRRKSIALNDMQQSSVVQIG